MTQPLKIPPRLPRTNHHTRMNITFLWTRPSGYMAACVRALSSTPDTTVTYISIRPHRDSPFDGLDFGHANAPEIDCLQASNTKFVSELVQATHPHVVVVAGWSVKAYVKSVRTLRSSGVRLLLAADTPIRHDFRQKWAFLKIGRLLRRVDGILVPGERSYQLMRYWGVPDVKIFKFLYGMDYQTFADAHKIRINSTPYWPKSFLYSGRYVPSKGITELVAAFAKYQASVKNPWPLRACGTGALKKALTHRSGITDLGFVQPRDQKEVFCQAGAFIMPSRHEPWGQAIVEAAAAGLPLVCTSACGASAELVRQSHNGIITPSLSAEALADAMLWMHHNHHRLPAMGKASAELAAAYAADKWASNLRSTCEKLCNSPTQVNKI